MNILILSSSSLHNQAGIVALDVYNSLKGTPEHKVRMIVKVRDKNVDKNILPIETKLDIFFRKISNFAKWIIQKAKERLVTLRDKDYKDFPTHPDYYFQEVDQTVTYFNTKKILRRAGFKPDVVLVLFMTEFVTFKNLYEINKSTNASIFSYLLDMGCLTGGCHYAWDCNGYTRECGMCPGLYSNDLNDQTYINFLFKKKYIEKCKIFPIVGSEWQLQQVAKSTLFKNKQKFKVLLSINDSVYQPFNKAKARIELGIPLGKKIILFGSVSITEKRKGIAEIIETLNILFKSVDNPSRIHLLIVGNNGDKIARFLPFTYSLLGFVSHEFLPRIFQAADVFVSPSIEDSGPMMINQALMCGTPVVAFEIGVALDLVINDYTGYKAKLKNCKDLSNGIKKVLDLNDKEYLEMSEICRVTALSYCHKSQQKTKLLEIFERCTN